MAAGDTSAELRGIIELCNTAVYLHGTDELADTASAEAWLGERDFNWSPSPDALAQLRADRERIRMFLIDRADPGAHAGVNDIVRRHWLGPRIGADAELQLVAGADPQSPVAAAVATLLLVGLRQDGRRLKVCASAACRYVYFDESRSRTRTWCDMNICGARSKMRDYRSRQAPEGMFHRHNSQTDGTSP